MINVLTLNDGTTAARWAQPIHTTLVFLSVFQGHNSVCETAMVLTEIFI